MDNSEEETKVIKRRKGMGIAPRTPDDMYIKKLAKGYRMPVSSVSVKNRPVIKNRPDSLL